MHWLFTDKYDLYIRICISFPVPPFSLLLIAVVVCIFYSSASMKDMLLGGGGSDSRPSTSKNHRSDGSIRPLSSRNNTKPLSSSRPSTR